MRYWRSSGIPLHALRHVAFRSQSDVTGNALSVLGWRSDLICFTLEVEPYARVVLRVLSYLVYQCQDNGCTFATHRKWKQ